MPISIDERTEYTRHGAAGQIAVECAGRPKESRPPRIRFQSQITALGRKNVMFLSSFRDAALIDPPYTTIS
jgi:hypothetical protein